MAHLFEPLTLRSVTLSNRVAVSPMCEYSSEDGFANEWHLVHLGSRAVGGAGLVMTEATAVEARGRISPRDLGLWKEAHIETLARIARFLATHGAVPGVQLAHAGRKASTAVPWEGGTGVPVAAGGWQPLAPSAIPFSERTLTPRAMTHEDIAEVVHAFVAASRRAVTAGFRLIELHFAHGYLVHEFLSPLSNRRDDAYGGGFEQRIPTCPRDRSRRPGRVARALTAPRAPVLHRLGRRRVDAGGERRARAAPPAEGVDLVDCSSGGLVPYARIHAVPGYQIPFARRVRAEAGVPTAAVGLISTPAPGGRHRARGRRRARDARPGDAEGSVLAAARRGRAWPPRGTPRPGAVPPGLLGASFGARRGASFELTRASARVDTRRPGRRQVHRRVGRARRWTAPVLLWLLAAPAGAREVSAPDIPAGTSTTATGADTDPLRQAPTAAPADQPATAATSPAAGSPVPPAPAASSPIVDPPVSSPPAALTTPGAPSAGEAREDHSRLGVFIHADLGAGYLRTTGSRGGASFATRGGALGVGIAVGWAPDEAWALGLELWTWRSLADSGPGRTPRWSCRPSG